MLKKWKPYRPLLVSSFIAIAVLTSPYIFRLFGFKVPISLKSGHIGAIVEDTDSCSGFFNLSVSRKHVWKITDFGGVGDGFTSNTEVFHRAIDYLKRFQEKGGSQLVIPHGRWLTGSFNLTSNFTLFLQRGAVILGSLDVTEWPIIEPLFSYGRGRERLGGRHISLIHGNGLSNVVITGENGTIDGQGRMWWEMWWNRTLRYTRGHLIELIHSENIILSNLTLRNSPFWTVHPVYSRNVVIKGMTILSPRNSPNTDGIDPDSCTRVCIEDCYIESGDDLVAVKSGWDHYGISAARPSSHMIIQRVSGTTPTCSGFGIGSEMSGGVFNITVRYLHVWDSAAGIRIKTDMGRGGYIENITVNTVRLDTVRVPLRFSRGSNDHPDDGWDRTAAPKVRGVFITDVIGFGSGRPPVLEGVDGAPPYSCVVLKNVTLLGLRKSKWKCKHLSGSSDRVFPVPCPELRGAGSC